MSVINHVRQIFKKVDIYGEAVSLNIKGKTSSNTIFGGILTIITFSLLTAAAWATGNDLVYKDHPNTNLEEKLLLSRSKLNLNKTTFPFAIALQDYSGYSYSLPRYFEFEIIKSFVNNTDGTIINDYYEFEACKASNFPRMNESIFNSSGIDRYWCMKDQNITIYGYWDESSLAYAILRIRLCKNSTSNKNHCASIEEITKFVNTQPLSWGIYLQNSLVNTPNYNEPFNHFILCLYKNIRLSVSKVYDVFIKIQEVQTDRGIIFQQIESQITYSFDYSGSDENDLTEDKILMDINLYPANHQQIYKRAYIKVQSLLANLGGLAKALMIASYIISFYFSKIKRNRQILNKVFDFILKEPEFVEKKVIKINVKKEEVFDSPPYKSKNNPFHFHTLNLPSTQNLIQSNQIFTNKISPELMKKLNFKDSNMIPNENENDKKTLVIKIIDELKQRNTAYKLKFNFCEIIKIVFCKKCLRDNLKTKVFLYKKSHKSLNEFLDISEIIHKLEEVDKLKLILLNHEQVAMFQFLSKNLCTLHSVEAMKSELNEYKELIKDKEKLLSLILDYKNKLNDDPTEIDAKLFNLLNEEIKNFGKF